jgi:sugar-specific transcriptional regulator TrmB
LSQEQVLKTLANLGFDNIDAQIYVYLAKKGMKKASEVINALKLTKQQLYPSLKRLQSKGIISSTIEHPARFSAIPFEKVLDLYIKAKIEETRILQHSKAEILSNWENLKLDDGISAKFTVIEGRSYIYSKIHQMIQETRNQVLAITTVPALRQADQRDIFDANHKNTLRSRIRFRFLAELSEQNVHAMKAFLNETANAKFKIEGRNPDLGLTLFPHMFIKDEEEAVFFVKPRTETSMIEKDDVCLWTDCKTLVKAFTAVFEELWCNSTDVQEKITEIETDKPTQKTFIIGNSEIAKKKYNKTMNSAKEDILIMTSSQGLIEYWKNKQQIKKWTEKAVTVKIMAPIVNENIKVAEQLSRLCSVKHVPPNYRSTTIIDGKHLFQFQKSTQEKQPFDSVPNFENTLYTNHPDYLQKTKNMLNEIWKNSNPPSAENLKSIFGTGVRSHSTYFPGAIRSPGPDGTFHPLPPNDPAKKGDYSVIEIVNEDPLGKLKEQDVLNEIINSQNSSPKNQPGILRVYSSQAIAIIHPPDFFELPPMLIRVHHIEKHSTFGGEDVIMINLWLETPSGPAYVPVVVFSDSPQAPARWGKHSEATPANRNVQLAKKDELQVWVHGNTLFAGWTVPIHLYPSEYILPPACILIEGYGNVKTEAYSVVQPTGGKFTAKQNGFDAFITFMHPTSKYSGPGTDGFLVRDFVMEVTPQFCKDFHPTLETKLIEKKKPL